jgi:hypothetical protein
LGLFAIALALFGLRFLNRDLLPFIADESRFLAAARAQLNGGAWVSFSPLFGSQGLHYGPTVLWLYGLVHRLAGSDPETHILVMTALMTVTNAAAAISIGRLFGDRYFVPGALLALVAASPYHFFWSRLAWDQSVEICAGIVVALLCRRRPLGLLGAAGVGLALGLGFSSHLMILPFVCAAFPFLFVRARRGKRTASLALALAVAAIVNIPYGLYLRTTVHQAAGGNHISAMSVIDKLRETFQVSGAAGMEFFFDASWQGFRSFSRIAAFVADAAASTLPIALCAGAIILIISLRRGNSRAQRMTAAFALVIWIGHALFSAWRGLPSYPQYQFPCWWIVPVAVAAGLGMVQRRRAVLYVALGGVWIWSLLHVAFINDWMRFVRQGGGMPGIHYSTVLSEQRSALRQACATSEPVVCLRNETAIFSIAIDYVASVEPACAGKTVNLAKTCSPRSGQKIWGLSYAQAGQARLVLR